MMRPPAVAALSGAALLLAGCAMAAANDPVAVASAAPAAPAAPVDPLAQPAPDSMRWLYGSGEAAGASIQAFRALADYAIAVAATKPAQSVPMGLPEASGGTGTVSCTAADGTAKPRAVVFDVDETLVLNLGFEYWAALGNSYSAEAWEEWERTGAGFVEPVPGAVTGVRRLREADIAVVYNTNREAKTAAGTIAAIAAAGFGTAIHGETLYLKGDDGLGSRKDGRRAAIAERYCVIALAGDNLGDFADVFNDPALAPQARRELAGRGALAQLWGNGWFALPNPVYGNSIRGTIGEVYAPEVRWTPAPKDSPAGQ